MKKANNCSYKFFCILTFCVLFLSQNSVIAQQTIINFPSSEILPAGNIILKDSNKVKPFAEGGSGVVTPSFTFGLGHGTEISGAVGTSIGRNTFVQSDISAKKVWFVGHSSRITLGGTISPYLSEHARPDSFVFTHFSQRIKETKTSLTAGVYLHGKNSFPDKFGVLMGIEQVIVPNKLRLALDWVSGLDSVGRMGVGLKYRPNPMLSITGAVIIPNKDSDNIAFNVSVSKFISLDDENPIKRRLNNVD